MSNKSVPKRDSYKLEVPLDIQKRKLPPLPIPKRKLPTLPQSKSTTISLKNAKTTKNTKIFITPPSSKKKKRSTSSLRNLLNSWQKKIGGSKTKLSIDLGDSTDAKSTNTNAKKQQQTSTWRPNIDVICNDTELLNILTAFMTKQYNEENILFLQSVKDLSRNINNLLMLGSQNNIVENEKIDMQITAIYNTFITNNSAKQINLSSGCFQKIMQTHQKFKQLQLVAKAHLFDQCCKEITVLIRKCVLMQFYNDSHFQSLALNRNIMSDNDYCIQKHKIDNSVSADVDYDSDDIEFDNVDEEIEPDVYFDMHSTFKWRDCKYMLSSKPFTKNSGTHEWYIHIIKTNNCRQEFGVISNLNRNIESNEYGVLDTPDFGARAVYGYNNLEPNFYYGSYNKDNTVRCNKDLSQLKIHKEKWTAGDVIKICLNLSKSCIKFYLNDEPIRKTISIEKDTVYYPIILYSGDCEYKVIC